MSGIWILKQSFNLSRGIGRLMAFGLALCALSVAGSAMTIKPATAQNQDQKRVAAQSKFDEGEKLKVEGSDESLRSALKEYEEALQLWREVNDPEKVALTLDQMGVVYLGLEEFQKGLEYFKKALSFYEQNSGDIDEEMKVAKSATKTGEVNGKFMTQWMIAAAYLELGEEEKAKDYIKSSLYDMMGENEKSLNSRKKADETSTPSQRP